MTTAQDGGRLSALRTGRLYPPRKYSWYSFLLQAEPTPGPWCDRKDFMSMKNPLTPAAIEPATFRFLAQHLNHCATAGPQEMFVLRIYFYISCYYCVICMCIVWRVSLHYPTRVLCYGIRSPKRPDGDIHSA